MRSAFRAVFLCCVTLALALPVHATETGQVIAVIQNDSGFRVALTNVGTVAWVEACGDRLICSAAFKACTKEAQDFGTLGDVTFGLKPGIVGGPFKHGLPFTKAPGVYGTATYLTPAGTDAETGAPLYNAPAGKAVYLIVDQKPAAGFTLGVETFFEIQPDKKSICWRRKVYATECKTTTLLTYKDFVSICSDSSVYTVNRSVPQAEITTETNIAHVFMHIVPGLNQTKLTGGTVADGDDFITEFNSCLTSGGFSTANATGARWLELYVDMRPGGSVLKKCGSGGFERFFGSCVELDCDGRPPGSGCPPGCDPENPGDPGEHVCPLSQGYFKTHGDSWPVASLVLGNQTYNKTELLALLNASVSGDASKILAKQLIAAKLNIANGADGAPIGSILMAADNLLKSYSGKLPYGVSPASTNGQKMVEYAALLELYNTSKLSPGCKDDD